MKLTSKMSRWLVFAGVMTIVGISFWIHQSKQRVFANYEVHDTLITKPAVIKIDHQKLKVLHYHQKSQDGRLWSYLIIDSPNKKVKLSDNHMFLYRGEREPFNNYTNETVKINGKKTAYLKKGRNVVIAVVPLRLTDEKL